MGHRIDDDHTDDDVRARVEREVHSLLASVHEVDVATVYRTVMGVVGIDAVRHIADAIGSGIRSGDIVLEPRLVTRDGPPVPLVRRGRASAW